MMQLHAFRLRPGQDLQAELQAFVQREQIQAGWIMTCVGSLTSFHLRLANQTTGHEGQGHFEIMSLVGTLSVHGNHLHLCVSDETGQTVGGHLLPGNRIYTTAELVIGTTEHLTFTREHDGSTPYLELQVRPRREEEQASGDKS
jgi:uncharacterized protein